MSGARFAPRRKVVLRKSVDSALTQNVDDGDKGCTETHAGANQLDHIYGANGFQPPIERHIHQA